MASEWRDITLGEFVSLQRGHDLTEPERRIGRVPVMGSAGQNGFHDTALSKGPGIVVGRSGASFGQVHFSKVDFWPHNTGLYVTDFKGNDPLFAFYFLKALDFDRFNSGSAQPSLNRNFIYPISIRVPKPAEQKAIAAVLGALDDKIELNRRMNATLEAMARALFQSWFVDFDPVRAKLDGRKPIGLDAPTAALFPDSFEHCDAELIPRGWRMVPIAEIADINYGKNLPATELRQSGFPVYGAAGVVGFYSTSMFEAPVTLVTSRGSGSGTVHQTYEPAFITNNSFTVIPRSEWLGRHYLRFSLLNADILSLVTGSAQPQLTITNFSYLKLLEPSKDVAVAFHKIVDLLWIQAAANDRESRTLATLRDTLLPKLLSGDLSIAKPTKHAREN